MRVHPERADWVDALFRYQSSIGMSVEEPPLFALPNEVEARASRLEASGALDAAARRRGTAGLALSFPIGFALRTFAADERWFTTPSYSMAGPMLRVELARRSSAARGACASAPR